jgi:hypothetical protein
MLGPKLSRGSCRSSACIDTEDWQAINIAFIKKIKPDPLTYRHGDHAHTDYADERDSERASP